MRFNQKSDVKNHLSARRHKTMLPFGQTVQPIIADNSGDEARDVPVLGRKSGLEFYAVIPVTAREVTAISGNSADEPTIKRPQA